MKKVVSNLLILGLLLLMPGVAFASSGEINAFTSETLTAITILASLGSVIFLIKGGYLYITSTGNPTAIEDAKKTIRNALIGLVIVIAAGVISSILHSSMAGPSPAGSETAINLAPIEPAEDDGSLAQVLIDAVAGFLKNIIQSATAPVMNGIISFLTNTPYLSTNSVVFNFWLVMVGIADSLFVVIIALIGLQVMSASSFGFEELTLKELLPKLIVIFLIANSSIFLIDWFIYLCQTMVHTVLDATGGINGAWIMNAFDPAALLSGTTALITLIFVIIFILLAVVLLLFYISRLMVLAFGAVVSPIICLLWLVPKMSGFATNAIKAYFVAIFSIFIHVVIIQLASAFLTIPGQVGANPVISVLIGIALFSVLLKSTSFTMQLVFSAETTMAIRRMGTQIFNVISSSSATKSTATTVRHTAARTARIK